MKSTFTRISAALLMIALASGCSLSKPYPQKTLHAIEVGAPEATAKTHAGKTLSVETIRIAEPYNGLAFVYKTGGSTFSTDYYNGFVAPPNQLMTGSLIQWLAGSKVFTTVVGGESAVDYDLSLETNITALYGDYSQKDSPQAVVEARFFVVNSTGGRFVVAFEKTYAQSEPVASSSPGELVNSWGKAYRQLLIQLTNDLANATIPASPATAP